MVGLPARGKSLIAQKGSKEAGKKAIRSATDLPQSSGILLGFQSARNFSMLVNTVGLPRRILMQNSSTRRIPRASACAWLLPKQPSMT